MSAAMIAASIGAVGAVAGGAMAANASKGAAKTGAQGAANAAAIDWEKIQMALEKRWCSIE